MSHVYRVTTNRPVSVLVKADSRQQARNFVAKEIGVSRLDTGDLLDAIHSGEKVYSADDVVADASGGADDTDSAGA